MAEATLVITRQGSLLQFVLQTANHAPILAQKRLDPAQRRQIDKRHAAFRRCMKGQNAADEEKLAEIDKELFLEVLPATIRREIQRLRHSLIIQTNDTTVHYELLHDGTDFLAMRLIVARQEIVNSRRRPLVASGKPRSMLVIADTLGDLKGANDEGESLLSLFLTRGPCRLLKGADANLVNITDFLSRHECPLIHYCGHIFRDPVTGNWFMPLHEGRISADDLPPFHGRPYVFVNACLSDRQGDGIQNFVEAFRAGSESGNAVAVVGARWRVPDHAPEAGMESPTLKFALRYYRMLFDGDAIGEALRCSRVMARGEKRGPMFWASYTLTADDPLLAPLPIAQPAYTLPGRPVAAPGSPLPLPVPVPVPVRVPLPAPVLLPVPVQVGRTKQWVSHVDRTLQSIVYLLPGLRQPDRGRPMAEPPVPGADGPHQIEPGQDPRRLSRLVSPSGSGPAGYGASIVSWTLQDKRSQHACIVMSIACMAAVFYAGTYVEQQKNATKFVGTLSDRVRIFEKVSIDNIKRNLETQVALDQLMRKPSASVARHRGISKTFMKVTTVLLVKTGEQWAADLRIENTGVTKAREVVVRSGDVLVADANPVEKLVPWDTRLSLGVAAREGDTLFARGVISYRDVFDRRQEQRFCFQTDISAVVPAGGLPMDECPHGR